MKKLTILFFAWICIYHGFSQGCLNGNWTVYGSRPVFSYILELDSCNKEDIVQRGTFLAEQLANSVYITLSSLGISNLSVTPGDSLISINPLPYFPASISKKIVAKTPIYYETYFFDYDPKADSNGFYTFPGNCSSGVKLVPDDVKYSKEKLSIQGLPTDTGDYTLIIWPYFWAFYYYPDYFFLEMIAVYAVYDTKQAKLVFANDVNYRTDYKKLLDYNTNINNLALEIVNDIKKQSIKH
jgi:hypothetical protein